MFTVTETPGALSWSEQDAVDQLMADPTADGVDVQGRDREGNLVLLVHASDVDSAWTQPTLISDEGDYGVKFSVDGIVFAPNADLVLS